PAAGAYQHDRGDDREAEDAKRQSDGDHLRPFKLGGGGEYRIERGAGFICRSLRVSSSGPKNAREDAEGGCDACAKSAMRRLSPKPPAGYPDRVRHTACPTASAGERHRRFRVGRPNAPRACHRFANRFTLTPRLSVPEESRP